MKTLKQLREETGLNQKEAAKLLDIGKRTLERYEAEEKNGYDIPHYIYVKLQELINT